MTKRPGSLTLVGWLFIAVGSVGLLSDLAPLVTSRATEHLAELKAEGWADLGPAWTSRALAVLGGAFVLRGSSWARWVLVVWMGFHIWVSAVHSAWALVTHSVAFTVVLYLLFRPRASAYFRRVSPSAT